MNEQVKSEEVKFPVTAMMLLAVSGAYNRAKESLQANKDTIVKVGAFAVGGALGAVAVFVAKR